MYAISLTDDTGTVELPLLNVPLTQTLLEGAKDVTTLDMNLYTDFTALKRLWSHQWKYMTEADFTILKGYYERQFTLLKYPLITITELGVTNIPVRMNLTPQSIIDNCGVVEDVSAAFRETVQSEGS